MIKKLAGENVKIILVAINAKYIHSALAVRSLYAYLSPQEKEYVHIKEFTVNQSEDLIISELFSLKPDVLAFSCYIWNIEMVISLAQTFKKILPDTKIVVGGPEVSYECEAPLANSIDFIIAGEGEQAFKALIQAFIDESTIAHPKQVVTESHHLPLDEIPFPYESEFHDFKHRIIYYESSRGCPFGCSFCLSSATQGVRFLSLDRVKADLTQFLSAEIDGEKIRQVKFVDRTFNGDKKHAMDIWKYLIKNDNGITNFHFEISGALLDDEMIDLIGQARKGLFQFEMGVQSTNLTTLEAINRNMDRLKQQKLFENIRKLKALGTVHLHLDLIVGLPYEDYFSFIQSFNDVMACYPHQLQVGFLKLLKGSDLQKNSKKYGVQYKTRAPYEILTNNFIDFEAVNKLKKIEHMVELFYNTGGYQSFIRFMLQKFKSPFDFFDALAMFWETNAYHRAAHKKGVLYTILYEFGIKKSPSDTRAICELLKFDMLLQDNIRTFPNWVDSYYSYDSKQVTRTTAIHSFCYDVYSWLNTTSFAFGDNRIDSLQQKDIKLYFDYSKQGDERCHVL